MYKSVIILMTVISFTTCLPAISEGKYDPKKYGGNGKYSPDNSAAHRGKQATQGKYMEDLSKYRYKHIDVPALPYDHIDNPYEHFADNLPYIHEPITPPPYEHEADRYGYQQEPDKYPYKQKDSKTSASDPFNTNVYHIEKPKGIALEYGSPSFTYAQKLKSLQEKAGNGKVEITLSAKAYNDGRYIAKKE